MRSMLTMLGIIIGVGAVICMVAIGQGAKSRIEQSILDLGVNMVVITPGRQQFRRRQPRSRQPEPPADRRRRKADAGKHAARLR